MRTTLLLLVLGLCPILSNAQAASYAEGGLMQMNLKEAGRYNSNRIPGFSIAVSGLEITMYGGHFSRRDFPDSAQVGTNGGFWNIGYIRRTAPREKFKRGHITMGFGVGMLGVNQMNRIHVNVHPGIQLNLTRTISIAASAYAGYGFKIDSDTSLPWNNNGYLSTGKWFFYPNVTVRINTNPMDVMGSYHERKGYWGGGMVHSEETRIEGDYVVTRRTSYYAPAGEYIADAIVTSTNYINLYPKMLVGTMKNYKGNSLAFGGGVAIRAGLIALDVEYLQGQIGFHQSKVGSPADHWKMRRTSVGLGINWFNIPFPLKGPSLVRFIFGWRAGKLTLDSNRPELIAGTPNPEELIKETFMSPFLAFEFGTLGMQLEFFNQKENGYASGLVLAATYLLPVRNPRK